MNIKPTSDRVLLTLGDRPEDDNDEDSDSGSSILRASVAAIGPEYASSGGFGGSGKAPKLAVGDDVIVRGCDHDVFEHEGKTCMFVNKCDIMGVTAKGPAKKMSGMMSVGAKSEKDSEAETESDDEDDSEEMEMDL